MSIAIIGDVHGDSRKLDALLRFASKESRKTIFVGDYINRGDDSKGVLDLLCDFRKSNDAKFLWGNHEIALLTYIKHGNFRRFLHAGGLPTLRSYLDDYSGDIHRKFIASFPESHMQFLKGLDRYYEENDLLVSHAGYNIDFPLRRTYKDLVLTSHFELFISRPSFDNLSVCGHYTQPNFKPFTSKRFICLDTGCGVGGPLTCLLIPERTYVSF